LERLERLERLEVEPRMERYVEDKVEIFDASHFLRYDGDI